MGVYNKEATQKILNEEAAIQEAEERISNSYDTNLFYGGAEVLVIAKNYDEAKRLEKLATLDFNRLKNKVDTTFTIRENIDHYEYDGNDFTIVTKESAKKIMDKIKDSKPVKAIKDVREKDLALGDKMRSGIKDGLDNLKDRAEEE